MVVPGFTHKMKYCWKYVELYIMYIELTIWKLGWGRGCGLRNIAELRRGRGEPEQQADDGSDDDHRDDSVWDATVLREYRQSPTSPPPPV